MKVVIVRESPEKTKSHGTAPDRTLPQVVLPEGYNGKILLVSVSANGIKKTVILRSGDLWHREILRNTEVEIKNLGFENALVHELGGALIRFEPDGVMTIYGASQEFGACDKEFAAEMVRKAFPERTVKLTLLRNRFDRMISAGLGTT